MLRRFGMNVVGSAAPPADTRESAPEMNASMRMSTVLACTDSAAATTSRPELPYAPASWRGSAGRRSISAD